MILTRPEAQVMIQIIETGDTPASPSSHGRPIGAQAGRMVEEARTFWGLSGRGMIAFDMKRDRWTVTAKGLNELALWAGV